MTSGQSPSSDLQRLAALSDGIFAVAMTLLAYNVHVPNAPLNDQQLGVALRRMLGEAWGLLMSFAVAMMFWMAHLRLFRSIQRADYFFGLINFGLLFSIVLLPISTSLWASFESSKAAVLVYGTNLALISALNLVLWVYAVRKGWLSGFDRHFPAILLELAPNVYSLSVFLSGLAVVPWKPGVAPILWVGAFGAPLLNRIRNMVHEKRARDHRG